MPNRLAGHRWPVFLQRELRREFHHIDLLREPRWHLQNDVTCDGGGFGRENARSCPRTSRAFRERFDAENELVIPVLARYNFGLLKRCPGFGLGSKAEQCFRAVGERLGGLIFRRFWGLG